MEFICYTDWRQLPEDADTLFSQASTQSVFFSRPWFENLLQHPIAEGDGAIRLACVVERGQLLAILPLAMRGEGHAYALTNLYSSLYTLLMVDTGQPAILRCLAQGLLQIPIALLRLEPVAEEDHNIQALQDALEGLGIVCQRRFRFYNWLHRTHGQTFADYMASRPARVRNTIARKARKLARERGYSIRLYTDHQLSQGMTDYHYVYQHSWKANELYRPFIDGLAEGLARQGWLRLAVLYVEQQPIAAQFWFVVHDKASIFKLVYDQAWQQYSPGSILTHYLMQQVIDSDKVSEIDFLTGNDAYKQDWMSERRKRWTLYAINPPKPKRGLARLIEWCRRMTSQHLN